MPKVNQSIATSTVTLSALARVLRTVLQTLVAFGGSWPLLVAALHLSSAQGAEASSVVAGIVFVASAIQNILEHFNVIPTIGGKAPTTTAATRT